MLEHVSKVHEFSIPQLFDVCDTLKHSLPLKWKSDIITGVPKRFLGLTIFILVMLATTPSYQGKLPPHKLHFQLVPQHNLLLILIEAGRYMLYFGIYCLHHN